MLRGFQRWGWLSLDVDQSRCSWYLSAALDSGWEFNKWMWERRMF